MLDTSVFTSEQGKELQRWYLATQYQLNNTNFANAIDITKFRNLTLQGYLKTDDIYIDDIYLKTAGQALTFKDDTRCLLYLAPTGKNAYYLQSRDDDFQFGTLVSPNLRALLWHRVNGLAAYTRGWYIHGYASDPIMFFFYQKGIGDYTNIKMHWNIDNNLWTIGTGAAPSTETDRFQFNIDSSLLTLKVLGSDTYASRGGLLIKNRTGTPEYLIGMSAGAGNALNISADGIDRLQYHNTWDIWRSVDISPFTNNYHDLGSSNYAWQDVWAYVYHDQCVLMDSIDDVAVIKSIGTVDETEDGFPRMDLRNLPPYLRSEEVNEKGEPFRNLGRFVDLLLGAIKQLDARIEKLEGGQ